jgi:hypothetical protein
MRKLESFVFYNDFYGPSLSKSSKGYEVWDRRGGNPIILNFKLLIVINIFQISKIRIFLLRFLNLKI